MDKKFTAAWQIRNGVYPVTIPTLEPIVTRIAAIEGFFVHLASPAQTRGRFSISPGAYDFERSASGKLTVAKWRNLRFGKSYPELAAQVVDPYGRIVSGDEMIGPVRGDCHWSEGDVLKITAWSPTQPHDDDVELLGALAREIQPLGFIDRASVVRPNLILRTLFGVQLQIFTKRLHLRNYELDVIVEILKEKLTGPGFEYEILRIREHDSDREFTSQDLNEI